jgi:cytochrome c peroxidase
MIPRGVRFTKPAAALRDCARTVALGLLAGLCVSSPLRSCEPSGRTPGAKTTGMNEPIAGMRRAGGPMLPTIPYRYSHVEVPAYINPSELEQADNTPADNPLTDDGATLGRVLFYDKHLSRNDAVSCASCHLQKAAFADPRQFSVGFQGGHTKRNAMGLANIRYSHLKGLRPGFFWDERAPTLEAQVLMPIQDAVEMGMTLEDLERKLAELPYYPPLFEAAFGSPNVTSERIAKAVAQFMRCMVSLDSKYDRAAARAQSADVSKDFESFTAEENLGKSLFMVGMGGIAEFACARCHTPPTFNMEKAFNIGLDLKYKDPGLGALGRPPNAPFTPSNDGKFKAPSLRNVALTAPYMHDGRFKTLEEVVEHYSRGVHPHVNLELAFEETDAGQPTSGLRFSDEQKAALVAFLKTLTDERFVSDPKFSDPFGRSKQ